MPKYLIEFDAGWGESTFVEMAETQEAANDIAYEAAKEEFENNSSYSAKLLTKELAEEHGLEDELEEAKAD